MGEIDAQMVGTLGRVDFDAEVAAIRTLGVNEVNELGDTAFFAAAEKGHLGIVKELLQYSFKVGIALKNLSGFDPLRMAASKEHYLDHILLFWVAVGGGSLIIIHLLILLLLRSRMGSHPHELFFVPRFELVLLVITLLGITQSSAFAINGGRTKGILIGAILLAIPIAFVSLLSLFLAFMAFPSSLMLYKEVKHLSKREPWYKKLSSFVVGPPTLGKWFYRDGLPSLPSRLGFYLRGPEGSSFLRVCGP